MYRFQFVFIILFKLYKITIKLKIYFPENLYLGQGVLSQIDCRIFQGTRSMTQIIL